MCKSKENLRHCIFTLEGYDILGYETPGMFDYKDSEQHEEATHQRIGLFHTWGTILSPKTEDGKILSCGIVEDTKDGKIYCINPEKIQFTND